MEWDLQLDHDISGWQHDFLVDTIYSSSVLRCFGNEWTLRFIVADHLQILNEGTATLRFSLNVIPR